MIHVSQLHKQIVVPWRHDIMTLFPHAKPLKFEGQNLIALPHKLQEVQLLRNLKLPAPAPIAYHYNFPTLDGKRAFAAQIKTCSLMTTSMRAYILNKMGVGKTRCAVWSFDFLRRCGDANKMLVVAPLSTLNVTWVREIMATIYGMRVQVLVGSAKRRLERLATDADIYIINHDGLTIIEQALMSRPDIDVICFDEVGAYRNARAERSKVARRVAQTRRWVWGMTGSPTPQAPTDAYGIAKLINPHTSPASFTRFRDEVMVKLSQFKWAPRKDASEIVARILQPSVAFTLDDVVELPPLIERQIDVEQGKRQRDAYKTMADHCAIWLKEGAVTAANGGVVLGKLLQIACGYVYADGRKPVTLDNDMRLEMTLDIVENTERKAIVFCPYLHAVAGLATFFSANHVDFAVVTGDVSMDKRNDIFNRFQNTDQIRVLLAHPQCMSHGLNLQAADTIVWFAPIHSLEIFEQANARIRRVGQKHKQQIFMLQGARAERLVYQSLRNKREAQDTVLDILADLTEKSS